MQINRPIAIAITLFIILLVVFFLVMPEYNKFRSLQTQLAQKTAEYNAEFAYYNDIAATYQQLQNQDNKADLQKIDNALPQGANLGQLIFSLQEIASQNGMLIKNLFLSKPSTGASGGASSGNVKVLTFSASMAGDYPSLEGFIVSLEKSARIFEVTNISFGSSASSPSSPSGSASSSGSAQSVPQAQQGSTFSLQIKTQSY